MLLLGVAGGVAESHELRGPASAMRVSVSEEGEPLMLTRSGKFQIFDITDFCPGRLIPPDFFACGIEGPWYFMPSGWQAPNWGGSALATLRKFPIAYSPGFKTAEEALAAAEEWEGDGYIRIQAEKAERSIWVDDDGEIHTSSNHAL